jgi:hypothetical protein
MTTVYLIGVAVAYIIALPTVTWMNPDMPRTGDSSAKIVGAAFVMAVLWPLIVPWIVLTVIHYTVRSKPR